jgi:hypothetical protein
MSYHDRPVSSGADQRILPEIVRRLPAVGRQVVRLTLNFLLIFYPYVFELQHRITAALQHFLTSNPQLFLIHSSILSFFHYSIIPSQQEVPVPFFHQIILAIHWAT